MIGLNGIRGQLSSLIGCTVSLRHVRYLQLPIFWYFWPSVFKTVVTVYRRKPWATCIFVYRRADTIPNTVHWKLFWKKDLTHQPEKWDYNCAKWPVQRRIIL